MKGRRLAWSALAAATAMVAGQARAQQGAAVGEIVVTAEKRISEYDANRTPHVVLIRRADFLITEVKVVCDTRDPTLRRQELKETLRAMIRSAGRSAGAVVLGVGDDVVTTFDDTMLDLVIAPDARTDTSRAQVLIKTPVSAADTFDGATDRINRFIQATPKSGRTEILRLGEWNLTIVGPERDRPALLKRIAEDARETAAAFGPGYAASVEGLQAPIAWYQQDPLDLALYITYRLTVAPPRS